VRDAGCRPTASESAILFVLVQLFAGCVRPAPPTPAAEALATPSPAALFQAHLEAIGGEAALRRRGDWAASGEVVFEPQGLRASFTERHAAPGRYRFTTTLPGGAELSSGYDGAAGWALSPGARRTGGAERAAQRQRADLFADADMARWVVESRTVGLTSVFDEPGLAEDAWEVVLTWSGGREGREWYALDGLRLARSESPDTNNPPTLTRFEDYRDLGGVLSPARVTVEAEDITVHYQRTDWTIGEASAAGRGDAAFALPSPGGSGLAEAPHTRSARGMLVLPLQFAGGERGEFLLDTGANTTLVDRAMAARLGLDGEGLDLVGGTAGGALDGMRARQLPAFIVGERAYDGYGALEVDLSGVGVDGVIGNDFLSLHILEIDPARERVRLHPLDSPPDVTGLTALPLAWFGKGVLRLALSLDDGAPFPALLDLGAMVTVVNERATFAAAAQPDFAGYTPAGALTGAAGHATPVYEARLKTLAIGPIEEAEPTVLVGNLAGLEALFGERSAGILGLDRLDHRRLVLDPTGPTLYLGPSTAATPPPPPR